MRATSLAALALAAALVAGNAGSSGSEEGKVDLFQLAAESKELRDKARSEVLQLGPDVIPRLKKVGEECNRLVNAHAALLGDDPKAARDALRLFASSGAVSFVLEAVKSPRDNIKLLAVKQLFSSFPACEYRGHTEEFIDIAADLFEQDPLTSGEDAALRTTLILELCRLVSASLEIDYTVDRRNRRESVPSFLAKARQELEKKKALEKQDK